jgi:hypothetical protein
MMKKLLSMATIALVGTMMACQDEGLTTSDELSSDDLAAISRLGFSTQNAARVDGGILVEGDIMLHEHDLSRGYPDSKYLVIAQEEQYRTTNLVSGVRTITVSVSSRLPSSYIAATDEALARYNALGLNLTFTRVSGDGDIDLVQGNGNYLASAGFPTSGGNPHGQVKVNSRAIGNQPQSTVATIIAHEIGHCIGFRHTDYMDRSYSCGGSPSNEGASTVGAIHIPGTPTGPDPNSWMLSCIGSGQNRPFNNNDKTALTYLY